MNKISGLWRIDCIKRTVVSEGCIGNLGGNGSSIEAFGDGVIIFSEGMRFFSCDCSVNNGARHVE